MMLSNRPLLLKNGARHRWSVSKQLSLSITVQLKDSNLNMPSMPKDVRVSGTLKKWKVISEILELNLHVVVVTIRFYQVG